MRQIIEGGRAAFRPEERFNFWRVRRSKKDPVKSAPLSNFTRPCVWAIALGVIVWAWGAEAAELGSTKVTAVRNLVTHKGVS